MTTDVLPSTAPACWWLQRPGRPSLLLEQRAALELAELFLSPVYYGVSVPHGDNSSVLLLPGFLGSDGYLTIMSGWLRRIGYRPHASGLRIVAGYPSELIDRVLHRVERITDATGRPLTVIGHSLGGVLARVVASMRPDLIDHIIAMGSPLCPDPRRASHPLVAALADVLVPDGPTAGSRATARVLERELTAVLTSPLPPHIRLSCIYSREDAVVEWSSCIDVDPRTTACEVRGTHIGLAWNAQVYQHIGRLLLT